MNQTLNVAIVGLGTVGSGVFRILKDNSELIKSRTGKEVKLYAVSYRDTKLSKKELKNVEKLDALALAKDPKVDVIVELIGGASGIAYELCKAALENKKSVVTANKALIAHHGLELAKIAEKNKVTLAFEAAVAGGIPVIKSIKEGLAANNITSVSGILNGTCNYILTTMEKDRRDFGSALKEAQSLGYAEADPSFDIDGVDTAHKLAILSSLAFGTEVNIKATYIEGIRNISLVDIDYALELGYRIKLLGLTQRKPEGITQYVHPAMVKKESPLANVDGVLNALVVESDFMGSLLLEGAGAGSRPTASAVVADIIDIASGRKTSTFNVPVSLLKKAKFVPIEEHEGAYYMRLTVIDKSGVLAGIASIFKDENISLESLLQRGRLSGKPVSIVLITHETTENAILNALKKLAKSKYVIEPPCIIRIQGE